MYNFWNWIKSCVLELGLEKHDELLGWWWICCWIAWFYVVLSNTLYIEPINVVANQFGWLRDQNWVFGWKRVEKIVSLKTELMKNRVTKI